MTIASAVRVLQCRQKTGNGVASKHLTFQTRSLPTVTFELVSSNKSEEAIDPFSIRFSDATELRRLVDQALRAAG